MATAMTMMMRRQTRLPLPSSSCRASSSSSSSSSSAPTSSHPPPSPLRDQQQQMRVLASRVVPSSTTNAPSSSEASFTHTITIETAKDRGSELRDFRAGILVALFDGEAQCVVDHVLPSEERKQIFDRDTREEVRIDAPGLGDVQRVWIAPATGTWFPETVTVTTTTESAPQHATAMEDDEGPSTTRAAKTTAVFRNACMLGSREGDAAADLVAEGAGMRNASSLAWGEEGATADDFAQLKAGLLASDAALVGLGAAALLATRGPGDAATFAAGGAVGFAYLLLLSTSVQGIGEKEGSAMGLASPPILDVLGRAWRTVLALPAARLLGVAVATAVVVQARMEGGAEVGPAIVETAAGLLTYKAAVLIAASLPSRNE